MKTYARILKADSHTMSGATSYPGSGVQSELLSSVIAEYCCFRNTAEHINSGKTKGKALGTRLRKNSAKNLFSSYRECMKIPSKKIRFLPKIATMLNYSTAAKQNCVSG
jgi:hypothetical protein